MNRRIIIPALCGIIGLLACSCASDETKAKEVVKSFCEAYDAGQSDKTAELYPEFIAGKANTPLINTENLNASLEDGVYKVEDGGNHIFYVEKSDGKFTIKDSKNVIEWQSELKGDITAAKVLGMVDDCSTDMQCIKAYQMLQNGSDLINFLNNKYPQAKVYGVVVDKVQQKKEGGYGIYWLELKAFLKSGSIEPLGLINVNFICKDAEGNVVTIKQSPEDLPANSTTVVNQMVDLDNFPNVKDVSVMLTPFNTPKGLSDIDLLCVFAPLDKQDYQEYLNSTTTD